MSHIADWYSTICVLAGVSFADDSPIKPLPIDPSNRTKDIYANGAYPGVDGVDLWPFYVTDPQPTNSSAAHPDGLWLSEEVMVIGDYKIVVAQQEQIKTNSGPTLGWKCGGLNHTRCDTTVSAECGENPDTKGPATPQCDTWVKATDEQCKCGCSFKDRSVFTPCLFDVANDPSEYTDLSALHPEMYVLGRHYSFKLPFFCVCLTFNPRTLIGCATWVPRGCILGPRYHLQLFHGRVGIALHVASAICVDNCAIYDT